MSNSKTSLTKENSSNPTRLAAEWLNSACFCISLDHDVLKQELAAALDSPALTALVEERCPYLFSAHPIFISDHQFEQMARVIQAIEAVVSMPSYRNLIFDRAPAIARHDPGGAKSIFFGYDFHVAGDKIGLIEVNTNAGGAMLNAVMARAHQSCCLDAERKALAAASASTLQDRFVDMVRNEWHLSKRTSPLQTITIVDNKPQEQYLYPEFLLFQRLFEQHGIRTLIADPAELAYENEKLWLGDTAVDLVYNRLTDFMLESPACATLRTAYLAQAVVLTPHPQAHALYADKRNLALLSDPAQLEALGVSSELQQVLLANIPATEIVKAEDAERLWSRRRELFFKPAAGYGSRATYRGDKLTKRVWDEILSADYVAQAIMAPGERIGGRKEDPQSLKFDIRCYAYDGKVQWMGARMYQGQTTNFRTIGGGFAPVYRLPDADMDQENGALLDSAANAMACCHNSCD